MLVLAFLAMVGGASASPADTMTGACQLRSNYDFLRDLAFTAAATRLPQKSADLSRLKRSVQAEGIEVRSVAYDPTTGRLECQMTLHLALPASARTYFGGVDWVGGPVRYWAEPQGDEGGFSIVTEGLSPIAAKIIEAAARFPQAPDFSTGAPRPKSLPRAASAASPQRAPPKAGFDCALASTPVELMICGNDALAEADRTMAWRYFAVRADLQGRARQQLLASQRRFLARRDDCKDEACLVGLYMARAAELARP